MAQVTQNERVKGIERREQGTESKDRNEQKLKSKKERWLSVTHLFFFHLNQRMHHVLTST
jgi:hypothetical protein